MAGQVSHFRRVCGSLMASPEHAGAQLLTRGMAEERLQAKKRIRRHAAQRATQAMRNGSADFKVTEQMRRLRAGQRRQQHGRLVLAITSLANRIERPICHQPEVSLSAEQHQPPDDDHIDQRDENRSTANVLGALCKSMIFQ